MIPKIGAALSKFLEPLKPVKRSTSPQKSKNGDEGGHGNLPFEKWKPDEQPSEQPASKEPEVQTSEATESFRPGLTASPPKSEDAEEKPPIKDLQAGLTQVIIDIHAQRKDVASGSGIVSYESGSREQKTGTRLPKGSMLDKKIG